MEGFAKIVKGFKPLTIFTKPSILDPWLVLTHSSYAAE